MKINLSSIAARCGAIALVVIGCTPGPAAADDFTVTPGLVANLPAGMQDSFSAQAQQQANSMLNYMLLKLDEINRVCRLSGAQRIKLKVAAKGAIDHALAEWMDALGQQFTAQAADPLNGAVRQVGQVQVQFGQAQAMPAAVVAAPAGAVAVPAQPAAGRRGAARGAVARGNVVAEGQVGVAAEPVQLNVAPQQAAFVQAQAELAQRQAMLQQQLAQMNQPNNAGQAQQQQADQLQAALLAQQRQLQQQQVQLAERQLQQQRQTTVVEQVVINENGVNRVVNRVRRVSAGPLVDETSAEKQQVWTSALESTLSAEQRKQLSEAEAARAALMQKVSQNTATASERLVFQIDQWLLLDPAQRGKVTDLVDKTLELPTFKVQVQRTPQLTPAITDRVIKRMPTADMTAMLTPLQTTRWQQAVQSQLPQGAQGGEVQFGGLKQLNDVAVPVVPAVPRPVPVPVR